MHKYVYSHHFARLEVKPDTPNHEPVFRVDNATSFDPLLSSSSVTSPAQSGNLSLAQDLGGPPALSGVGAPLTPPPSADACARPSLHAPLSASSSATVDPLSQDAAPETCCLDDRHFPPLPPPPHPPFPLSSSAPPLYPTSFQLFYPLPPVHRPLVSIPCAMSLPDQLPVTSSLPPCSPCVLTTSSTTRTSRSSRFTSKPVDLHTEILWTPPTDYNQTL